MINPVGISPFTPKATPKTDNNLSLSATATKVAETLIVPTDGADWDSWQQQRALLHHDNQNNAAIASYRDIANAPLREQLQLMVGVDLFV
ncbi:hypothetical protein [Ferrimonas lipolytica]|uniref:Uncharacterized protein n=1 Tax=Ferrimonas lipolytica TaxID=2724191 RepID=A0A6H1UEV9_9GAMM|nr:hypothetical protein [Ferrimonas lipolytica]QIZ76746.1 hypothetical protein HER31_07595 [Ferrimonas lipolytica]